MSNTKKLIFFDLDGTLLNIENRYLNMFNDFCKTYDINNIEQREFWKEKREGKSNPEILIQKGCEESVAYEFHENWVTSIESVYWLGFDTLQPYAVELLESLKKKNVDMFLLTARNNRENLIQQLIKIDINKYFKEIINVDTNDTVNQKRKHLETYLPEIFVGDSEFDYLASKSLDINFYCVTNGFRSHDFLKQKKVKKLFSELSSAASEILDSI